MRNTVFVDSAAWIALLNKRDDLHDHAKHIQKRLRKNHSRLVTTQFILLEVADAFSSANLRATAVAHIEEVSASSIVEVIPVSADLFTQGFELFRDRRDKNWSLTDCISFVVMNDHGITDAFTSDHHFEQAGFQILL